MTHEEPTVDEVAQFALVSSKMETVRAYAQRGRQYGHLTAEELHALYGKAIRTWAANPDQRSGHLIYGDVVAEYSMRGQTPPSHSVVRESAIIGKAVAARFYALSQDKRREISREMLQEYVSAHERKN